jgi:hypothetical protein
MIRKRYIAAGIVVLGAAGMVIAQRIGGAGGGMGGGGGGTGGGRFGGGGSGANGLVYMNGDPYGREPDGRYYSWPRRQSDLSDRHGVPEWENDPHFKGNMFTFARVNYHSWRFSDSWLTDYPMSDLNFSFRLQETTSFKVNTNPVTVKLTDPELLDYPMVYMVEVATLQFTDEEIAGLRKYLLNGGFLMVDDFWGVDAWNSFHEQMQRVFPDREPTDLDLSHPIFHCVFDLKEKPQVPGITFWARNKDNGITWEKPDAKGAHYWSYFDDKGRMMTLICHNTDLTAGRGNWRWRSCCRGRPRSRRRTGMRSPRAMPHGISTSSRRTWGIRWG